MVELEYLIVCGAAPVSWSIQTGLVLCLRPYKLPHQYHSLVLCQQKWIKPPFRLLTHWFSNNKKPESALYAYTFLFGVLNTIVIYM